MTATDPSPATATVTPGLDEARALLRERFGFADFKPGQEAAIAHLLAGDSAAAVFPTGGGKSLCYQLPALLFPGLTLVVSPLLALMKDQIDALRELGVAAARLDSTLDADATREVVAAVRDGAVRILYVAPERFQNERFRALAEAVPISLFAVDEAHCISEWGHNFRPDYLKLPRIAADCGAERVLALTATATPRVLEDVCRGFGIDPARAVRTGFYRPNLELLVSPTTPGERDALLVERLRGRDPGSTIVYVTLQRTAEEVTQRLRSAGFDAQAYHAGMDAERRETVQDGFLASDRQVVVATIAFGMGIDKPDIRQVVHYNLPKSLENLAQEIGRAGRDGAPAVCELLPALADLDVLANFAYGDTPSLEAVRGLVGEVLTSGPAIEVSHYDLSQRHDIRILVVKTLLTYLELGGYVAAGTPRYASYRFQPKVSSAEILGRFAGDRQELLRDVFRRAKKGRTWLTLDLDAVARELRQPRDRLVRALDYLAQQDLLVLEASGVRHPYRVLQAPDDLDLLATELHERTLEHEEREVERLGQVVELLTLDGCLTAALCEYFGEPIPGPCGHCIWCHTGQPRELPATPPPRLDPAIWDAALALVREHRDLLAEPRALARFLTGLTSPRLSRARLSRHPLAGALAGVPFAEVMVEAESRLGEVGEHHGRVRMRERCDDSPSELR